MRYAVKFILKNGVTVQAVYGQDIDHHAVPPEAIAYDLSEIIQANHTFLLGGSWFLSSGIASFTVTLVEPLNAS